MHTDNLHTHICAEKDNLIKRYVKFLFLKKPYILDGPYNVNIENGRCMRHAHSLHENSP